MRVYKLEDVLVKMMVVHNNIYDYSLISNYKNKNQKVDIICKLHGVFNQIIGNHLYHKNGCPECALKIRKKLVDPISNFIKVHGDIYDYSKVRYQSIKNKVEIICKIHGSFLQTPSSHLKGSGCPSCGIVSMSNSLKKPLDIFLDECSYIHNNLYDYSKVKYNKLSDKIVIICKLHGEFNQRAFSHKQGNGCIKCNKSRGEKKVEEFLINNKIDFEFNKHFDSCRNKNTLPFDFYIPFMNLCIEYDGIQHSESIEYFGGDEKLKYQNKLDLIKDNWCLENNINIIRISYKDFNRIENILGSFFYKNKKDTL